MGKKSAKDILFKVLSTVEVDVVKHAAYEGVVSDLYYNQYAINQEQEFNLHLSSLYKAFVKEINAELVDARNPLILLEGIKSEVEEVNTLLKVELSRTEDKIDGFPFPVPQQMKTFFKDMADIQLDCTSRVDNLVFEKLNQLRPEPKMETIDINTGGLTIDFNLQKNEAVALILLLKGSGIISNKSVAKLLDTFVRWREFDTNGKPIYNKTQGASTLIWKIENNEIDTDGIVEDLKKKINSANIKKSEN